MSHLNSSNVNNGGANPIILQTLKRRANKTSVPLDERVTLERVYGLTSTSNSRLAQSIDGTIAYLAGCVIVLYYPGKQCNNDFIISSARKTLTTIGFSADGRWLATGESGHDPRVRVWDVKDKIQIAEFAGHKFSIECVYFSPNLNSNLLVSIGSQHDMVVNVWNLKTRFKAASNKISCKIKGMSFSRDGSYFVTVANRHVKFWYLTTSSLMETVPLKGRAAILGDYKNYYFCDVVCGSDDCAHLTYALTSNGILCEFNENRYLSRAIDLRSEYAYCLYADNFCLFVGSSNGNINIFKQKNLEFLSCLPRPHYLGVDVSQGKDTSHVIETVANPDLKYPDCVALSYNKHTGLVTAIYNDHSMYTWDISDLNKVKKFDSHLFHSSCCSSLDIYTNDTNTNLPLNSFVTCSTDNTLRIWSSVSNNYANKSKLNLNIYSKELLKIIYIDNDLSALCDIDQSLTAGSSSTDNAAGVDSVVQQQVTNIPIGSINNLNTLASETTTTTASIKMGARCLKISPIGDHLASGDRNGNIKIFDLNTLDMIGTIEAHDCEIMCLQYSQIECGKLLLASSSRDRLIHIFDATSSTYTPIQTIDDHSSSISAVRFCYNQLDKQLYLISCGNDKSIMVRTLTNESNQFQRSSYAVEKQTFYDLNVDNSNACINTISQDRMVRTYSIKDGKRVRQFRGSLNEDGHLIKMDTDRTGNLIAVSCTDKCVYIWDLSTCECVGYIYGHAEVVADLKFTSDNQHLITVSGDGCVFVWRLNNLINNNNNNNRRSMVTPNLSSTCQQQQFKNQNSLDTIFDQNDQLPAWAKSKLNTMTIINTSSTASSYSANTSSNCSVVDQPARRSRAVWGPPVIDTSFAVMSESDLSINMTPTTKTDADIQFPSPCVDKDYFKKISESTSDSSDRRMLWPIEDDTISDETNLANRLSSTLCVNNLTFRRNESTMLSLSPTANIEFNSDFSKILNQSPTIKQTPAFNKYNESDSILRRQSLSARYLMKQQQQQQQQNGETPVSINLAVKQVDVCELDSLELASKKKSLCTHTESSLSKTRSKSIKRSPSASSLSNESRSSINSIKTKCSSAKSSPQRPDRIQDDNNLKKALSMVSLASAKQNVKKNMLPTKTLRQIKQRSIERTNEPTSRAAGAAPATTFIEQNKHLRKLSSSIQNITHSAGLSLLNAPGSNLPPQAPRALAKSVNFELSPKKAEMLSSSSSSSSSQNEEGNLRESSLSSSSSSSCSIYEQAVQLDNECDKKMVSSVNSVGKATPTPTKILNRSADFCQQSTTNSHAKLNSSSHTYTSLKKPITFASLATSHSNNIILNSSNSSFSNSQNATHSPNQKNFTNEKIESILYEFKQNMYILDLIYDQVSNNLDEFKQLQHTANLIQTSKCGQSQLASAQTLQIIQTFNTSIYSIVKQFKAMLTNQNGTQVNASSNEVESLETNKIDTDLEYV